MVTRKWPTWKKKAVIFFQQAIAFIYLFIGKLAVYPISFVYAKQSGEFFKALGLDSLAPKCMKSQKHAVFMVLE